MTGEDSSACIFCVLACGRWEVTQIHREGSAFKKARSLHTPQREPSSGHPAVKVWMTLTIIKLKRSQTLEYELDSHKKNIHWQLWLLRVKAFPGPRPTGNSAHMKNSKMSSTDAATQPGFFCPFLYFLPCFMSEAKWLINLKCNIKTWVSIQRFPSLLSKHKHFTLTKKTNKQKKPQNHSGRNTSRQRLSYLIRSLHLLAENILNWKGEKTSYQDFHQNYL